MDQSNRYADLSLNEEVLMKCDKRAATCQAKFDNFLNFRGFPHMPGEDWLTAYPRGGQAHDGGSLVRP